MLVRMHAAGSLMLCMSTSGMSAQTGTAAIPAASSLRAGLVGRWQGALGYRDYQTNKLSELAVSTVISAVPDRVTQLRTSKFDEGPKRDPVWITTVSIDDPKASSVTSASFRSGRSTEVQTESMAIAQYTSPTKWKIVYSQTGMDDDKPAEIQVTETRDGADLLSIKEVRPVGGGKPWQFRNQTRLRLVGR